MTVLYDEWLKSLPVVEQTQRAQSQRIQMAQDATIARTVIEHPGWQLFLDALDAILVECQGKLIRLKDQMALGMELGPELERLKLESRTLVGHIAGIQMAKDLIPQAIAQGTEAVMKLTTPPA